MSCLHPESEAAPAWFVEALADSGDTRAVEVGGVRIEYRVWGPEGAPVVVLVHGGAAHGGWWDHLAPHLAKGRRVAALDLSGHGSSGSRTDYDFLTWADEVVEVASVEGSDQPFVIGHSMGGVVALAAAFRHAARLAGAVVVDLPDWVLQGRVPPRLEQLPARRHHATRESAERRFRARPSDPMRQEYIERHVAERSIHRTADGWTWRFDHAVTTHDSFPDDLWGTPRCPVTIVLAERSLLASEDVDQMTHRLGGVAVVTIADSGHHIMLDQPLALLAGLEDILLGWS